MIRLTTLAILAISLPFAYGGLRDFLVVQVGQNGEIPLPAAATYRRTVQNAKGKQVEHIYRVCNGKNKAKCGFWENLKTKKKVASGVTTYNKKKEALIVKKMKASDFGTYMTGNKNHLVDVLKGSGSPIVEDDDQAEGAPV